MAVIVDVDGAVIAPVIVDVHVHGNDTLIVIGAWCPMAPPVDGIDHAHGFVHVQVHGHDHGADHVNVDDHVDGHAPSRRVTSKPGNDVLAGLTTQRRDVLVEAQRR